MLLLATTLLSPLQKLVYRWPCFPTQTFSPCTYHRQTDDRHTLPTTSKHDRDFSVFTTPNLIYEPIGPVCLSLLFFYLFLYSCRLLKDEQVPKMAFRRKRSDISFRRPSCAGAEPRDHSQVTKTLFCFGLTLSPYSPIYFMVFFFLSLGNNLFSFLSFFFFFYLLLLSFLFSFLFSYTLLFFFIILLFFYSFILFILYSVISLLFYPKNITLLFFFFRSLFPLILLFFRISYLLIDSILLSIFSIYFYYILFSSFCPLFLIYFFFLFSLSSFFVILFYAFSFLRFPTK